MNATINYGSILCMKVADVKSEYGDYCMEMPISVLTTLGADFDGDTLNIIRLIDKQMVEDMDGVFNPKTNMYISRNDGLFNNAFNLFKDEIIGLGEFCRL